MPTGAPQTGRLPSVRGVNGWRIALRLTTEARAIRTARKLAAAAARQEGASDEDALAIEVAIGEALANARQHAYAGGKGPVAVDLVFSGRRGDLTITIHDSGKPVTARPTVPAELPPTGEGGRGLFVISRLMDGTEIKHPARGGRGTAIRFVKRIRAPK